MPAPIVERQSLTHREAGGALLMAGFGLGTLPAVTATALGITTLARAKLRE